MTEQTKPNSDANVEQSQAASPAVGKGAEELNKLHINIPRPTLNLREFKFSFRKQKDALGEEVKRPSLNLFLPVPTIDGLVDALANPKICDFVLDVLADTIKSAAKDQVDDETSPVNAQEELDLSKLTLEYLASQPKAERTGGGISKETWEAWSQDYITVMCSFENANEEHVKNAAMIFVKRYAPVKTLKPVLMKLRERLAIYTGGTKNLEEFQDVVEFLDKKAETLLKADTAEDLLASI